MEKMTLPDGTAVASDPLFYDREGKDIVYPLGTYRVTEVQASRYYQLDGKIVFGDAPEAQMELKDGAAVVLRKKTTGQFYIMEISGWMRQTRST